jgi:hypothetical protein
LIEFDESEHTSDQPAKWWELLDDSAAYVRFHYEDIQQHGSDELKRAVEIVLSSDPPGGKHKKIS